MHSFLDIAHRALAIAAAALLAGCAATATAPSPASASGAASASEWSPQPPNPAPPYPAESRMNGEQGMVLLRVRTSPAGLPLEVRVERSSGFPRLDRAASETVWRWRFQPTPDDGAVVWREVPMRFFITSPPPQPAL